MAERSNAAVLKTVVRVTGPGVRIPLSPPKPLADKTRAKRVLHFQTGKIRKELALAGV